jgi:LysR family transcriptional regulator, chromosome initiation inhibitor
VDDQDHTAEWLRSGAVLAAVTGTARPATGCNSRPLGAMRYLAAASPAFVARHFAGGVGAGSLAQAPSLVFNTKDELQARWVRRLCHRHVELPRHTLPSSQAFVTAALAGMGWGMHPAGAGRAAPGRRHAGRTGARHAAGRAAVLADRPRRRSTA